MGGTFKDFRYGYRCPYCYGNAKYTYKYIKGYFKSKGCELLSKEYKNVDEKLEYIYIYVVMGMSTP